MAKGVFVTGSGTGVGKTYVAARLMQGFIGIGRSTTYMKPVETGCGGPPDGDGGQMPFGDDALYALDFASCGADISLHSPYRFAPPCSPHLAARRCGREVCLDTVTAAFNELAKETAADIIIVEGPGGVLVPLNEKEYVVNMISALNLPAILVVDPGLGTLNHTLLSLRELERNAVPVIGVVINNSRNIERDFIYEDNAETIRKYISPASCIEVDYSSDSQITEFCKEILAQA